MIIKPTVGRVVWYWPNEHDMRDMERCYGSELQPFDAHILYVWSDFLVNLIVFDHTGNAFRRTSVHLKQDSPDAPILEKGKSHCSWMPYQIGQAKKHEGENNA